MRTFQLLLMDFSLVGALVLTVCWAVIVWKREIAFVALKLLDKWRRIGNLGRVLLFTFVTAMIVWSDYSKRLCRWCGQYNHTKR